MTFGKTFAAGLFAITLSVGTIQATPIAPGGNIGAGGITSLGSLFASDSLLNTIAGTFVSQQAGDYNGNYSAKVYKWAGGLDFVYSFASAAASSNAIQTVTMGNFSGFSTDLYYIIGGVAPATLSGNSATRSADGKNVKFIYDTTGIAPGQTADTLVIRTNATNYVNGTFTFQNGSTSTVAAYAPGVPEPTTYLLLGSGLTLIGFLRRKLA